MVKLLLTKNKFALVDDEDFETLTQFKWHFDGNYAARCIKVEGKLKKIYMHKVLAPFKITDHINRDRLDNRKENLRSASASLNAFNRESCGAFLRKTGKRVKRWTSEIMLNGKKKSLGYYLTKEEAQAAYLKIKNEVLSHG